MTTSIQSHYSLRWVLNPVGYLQVLVLMMPQCKVVIPPPPMLVEIFGAASASQDLFHLLLYDVTVLVIFLTLLLFKAEEACQSPPALLSFMCTSHQPDLQWC